MKASNAIKDCEIVVGYKTYVRLLSGLIDKKEVIVSAMKQEIARVGQAIEKARQGKKVCLISSGDPGIYGMAGPALELLGEDSSERIKIEIIPGITSACVCAGILGAPLMHDFAVISLSDLLTELALIEKRVKLAAQGDYVIVFYNPQSKNRTEPLKKAWETLMKHRPPKTPVGIVKNACRDNQDVIITNLSDMLSIKSIDMRTTIIIGNSSTYVKNGYMITPRGYALKDASPHL